MGITIFKQVISLAAAFTMALCIPMTTAAEAVSDDVFYEDFSVSELDTDKWLVAEKNWGGTVTADGIKQDYNGGVITDNVAVRGGNLILTGLGNGYTGEKRGINRDGSRRADGKRCGGAIATKNYFGSGSYEIRAKIAPELGCCSAMWTFEYEEHYSGDDLQIVNHEIDVEFPGRGKNDDFSLSHVLCTTWLTEEDYKTHSVYCGDQADGEFHTYRFDWHTGDENETPRVEYYFDGEGIMSLPFDSDKYDCSDACPISGEKMVFSSTMNGGYDLYYYDGSHISPLTELNSDKNELGADFFAFDSVIGDVNADGKFTVADLVLFQKWLLAVPDAKLENRQVADLCKDGRLDVFDLCLMRKELV